jgi:hypothetical protein
MSNLFTFDKERKILAFITEKGHISGNIMKGIDFRMPRAINELNNWMQDSRGFSDILITDHVVFVVYRKHYNSKVNDKDFTKLLDKVAPQLQDYKLRITNEDLPQFKNLITQYFPNIIYYERSNWEIIKKK